MKTAVSVPDELFKRVDRMARGSRRSRSEVYTAALRECGGRHAPDEIVASLDAVVDRLDDGSESSGDAFRRTAARRVLESTEW